MSRDNCPIANGGIVADADLVGEDAVEDHLMPNIDTFSNLDSAPTVHSRAPRLDGGDENQLVEKKTPAISPDMAP